MAKCASCNGKVGCRCRLKALPDGREVCASCFVKLSKSIATSTPVVNSPTITSIKFTRK